MSENKHTDFEREPVPLSHRKNWLQLSFVWLGIAIALSATVLGGTLGGGLSFAHAVIAAILGPLVIAIGAALTSIIGAKTGLSTSFVSRFSLGIYGSYAVSIILAIALFGWFGVQLSLFGASLQNIFIDVFGQKVPTMPLTIIGGILMTLTAVVGFKAIEKLSIVAVPLILILLMASLWKVLSGSEMANVIGGNIFADPLTIGKGVSLVIGSFATGIVVAPDISRYAKTAKDAVGASLTGLFLGFSVVLIIAALLAKATHEVDIVQIMLGLGWGTFAMLVLILAQWTTNDNNLYSSALGFSLIVKKIPKYQLTLAAGTVGTILAVAGIYDQFTSFLTILSIFIPPIGGIYVADFLIRPGMYHFDQLGKVKKVNPIGVSVWFVASVFSFLTTPEPNGLDLFQLTGSAGIDALLIGFILQFMLVKVLSWRKRSQHQHSEMA